MPRDRLPGVARFFVKKERKIYFILSGSAFIGDSFTVFVQPPFFVWTPKMVLGGFIALPLRLLLQFSRTVTQIPRQRVKSI